MKIIGVLRRLLLGTLVIPFLLTNVAQAESKPIVVASKNFSESYLLAEMLSQLLEASGQAVERRFGLGGTLVCYEALTNSEIDVYVEYSGTVSQAILKQSGSLSMSALNEQLQPIELELLDSIGFNNTYAVAIKQKLALERDLKTVSDLADNSDLRIAFSLEFLNREDGWPGLKRAYGFTGQPTGIEHGLAYQAIEQGSIDITDAYSTDGDLERYQLVTLKDDKGYFPEYVAAPLIRQGLDAVTRQTLNQLSGMIDEDTMRRLNGEVVVQNRTFAEVASSYLFEAGLLEEETDQSSAIWDRLIKNTITHLQLTSIALLMGCVFGLSIGVMVYRSPTVSRVMVYLAGLMQTIPSIALLALMIPMFGIGFVPAIIALFLYSILPILRNTITALLTIDPLLKRVADAIGLTPRQQLRYVLLPLALPNILAGIKTAAVISIGTATLAAFIGAGGLGEPIVTGLALNDSNLILQGALPAAGLAIIVELLFELLERVLVKPHMLKGVLPD
ncbi:MAG: osmoprotectant transport system permease protein [Candidatus Azotimanducaceae bacterium]|jgi:osmoprotectant transport system permease protein